ncbi:MAG: hypothetical protein ACI8VT_002114, partial [Saprospiraceae bacterium]
MIWAFPSRNKIYIKPKSGYFLFATSSIHTQQAGIDCMYRMEGTIYWQKYRVGILI